MGFPWRRIRSELRFVSHTTPSNTPVLGGVNIPSLGSLCSANLSRTWGTHPAQEPPGLSHETSSPAPRASAPDPIPWSPRCSPGATGDTAVGSTDDRGGFGGVGMWDPLCGATKFPYTPYQGCYEHRSLQGRLSPSVPFKGAREPSGSTGADLATVTANPLQFVPHSCFYLTGLSQAPPASICSPRTP